MKHLSILFILFFSPVVTAQKTAIQLNLEKGAVYEHHVHSESEVFSKNNGKTSKFTMLLDASIHYKVKSFKKDIYTLEAQYGQMDITVHSSDGSDFVVRSDGKADDLMSNVFHEMCQSTFELQMTKYGEITKVEGIERLYEKSINDLPVPAERKEKLKVEMASTYGEKSFKGNFEIITLIYPKTLVALNESWQTETNIYSKAIEAKMVNTYTWLGLSDDGIIVSGKSSVLSDGENISETSKKIDGSSTILLNLDKETGWIRKGTVNSTMRVGTKDEDGYIFTKLKTTYTNH